MKHYIHTTAIVFFLVSFVFTPSANAQLPEGNTNPLFKEKKVKNFMPHMSWAEVEEALKETDMVILPVGSIEQHGKHLPLGTDSYIAVELSKLIAQKADVLVAPSVLAGLSEHHMGFPGTLTLTPETFEAVVYESALSLIQHGFRKIMILNGHGGNSASVENIIQKINQTTPAIAIDLMKIDVQKKKSPYKSYRFDWHAGVEETSLMLYLTGDLVQMSKAENPVLTFPPNFNEIEENSKKYSRLGAVASAYLFRPEKTGKKGSSREMSSNGTFTTGDVKESSAERGKWELKDFIEAAVKFIQEWKELGKE